MTRTTPEMAMLRTTGAEMAMGDEEDDGWRLRKMTGAAAGSSRDLDMSRDEAKGFHAKGFHA